MTPRSTNGISDATEPVITETGSTQDLSARPVDQHLQPPPRRDHHPPRGAATSRNMSHPVTGRDASIALCYLLIVLGFVASWDMRSPGGVTVMVGFTLILTLALRFGEAFNRRAIHRAQDETVLAENEVPRHRDPFSHDGFAAFDTGDRNDAGALRIRGEAPRRSRR
jgi:hypothetical protein